MIPILKKTDQKLSGIPTIYIAYKTSDFKSCTLSDNERVFLKERITRGENLITINRLDSYICFLISDHNTPFTTQLEEIRKMSAKVLPVVRDYIKSEIFVCDLINDPEISSALIEGLVLSNYKFDKYLTKAKKNSNFPGTIHLFCPYLFDKDLECLMSLLESVYIARDLVNEPLSHLNAVKLAERIQEIGAAKGVAVEVMNRQKIKSLKMGGLLAVNKGSVDPPTFSVMEWKPENHINDKPFVLVGKGLVYDTGGLSLKPTANSMDYMKSDMAGAAAVIGAISAVAGCRLPVHIIGLIPATDNRPDGNAIVPGDIITMHDGTSVEVLNTDAEGRLLLGDALSWAKQFDPALVIDLATLTGSAAAAIGIHGMAAMQNQADSWYKSLEESGYYTSERTVLFPLWDEYKEMLKSDVADLKNIGGREAGTITAGKFLEHFTSYPWIHLDIAGTAFLHSAESYKPKGATGWGVRVLFDFFRKYAG